MEVFVAGLCMAVAVFVMAVFWIMQGQIQELRLYVSHTMRQQHDLAVIVEKLADSVVEYHPVMGDYGASNRTADEMDIEVARMESEVADIVDDPNQLWACEAEYKSGKTWSVCYSRLDAQSLAKELLNNCGAIHARTWPL